MNEYLSLLLEKRFEDAEKLRREAIPRKLIKFYSLGNGSEQDEKKLRTLEEEQLWVSSIEALNDPYEFSCMYIDKMKLKDAGYAEELILGFENLVGESLKKFGQVSLSGNSVDCLPMWAYYTNNYAGYCVEYDVIRPDVIHEISYEPNRIPIASIVARFYSEFEKMVEAGESTNPEVEFYVTIIEQQLFMKHISWKHENEYRIIWPIEDNVGVRIPLSAIGLKTKRIIAGVNCSEEHYARLQKISRKLECGEVVRTGTSETSYTLVWE